MNIASLNPVELIGYLASLLVFSTFYMKTMIPLRSVAIASNVAFITYGYLAGIYPVFFLHMVLLPPDCISSMKRCKLEPIANK